MVSWSPTSRPREVGLSGGRVEWEGSASGGLQGFGCVLPPPHALPAPAEKKPGSLLRRRARRVSQIEEIQQRMKEEEAETGPRQLPIASLVSPKTGRRAGERRGSVGDEEPREVVARGGGVRGRGGGVWRECGLRCRCGDGEGVWGEKGFLSRECGVRCVETRSRDRGRSDVVEGVV